MLAETMRRCGDTGLFVLDVEAIRLEPGPGPDGCESVLETAAVLGARYLNVICADPDTGRFTDRLAELVQMARPYRVRPVIEFMAWRPLRTLAGAVAIATGSDGAGLLLDTLHIQRCGATDGGNRGRRSGAARLLAAVRRSRPAAGTRTR